MTANPAVPLSGLETFPGQTGDFASPPCDGFAFFRCYGDEERGFFACIRHWPRRFHRLHDANIRASWEILSAQLSNCIQNPKNKAPPGQTRSADFYGLLALPVVELGTCKIRGRAQCGIMSDELRGELDHVAVWVAKIDRVVEPVMGDAAGLDTGILAFRQHAVQRRPIHLEGYMEIEVVLFRKREG